METLFLNGGRQQDIELAGRILREGGLVAIPTETVYGLAANALNGEAVTHIFEAKNRPGDNPLIVHICEFSQIYPLVTEVPESAKKLAEAFWPGPLTIILPKSGLIPRETSGGLSTVAVRFPSHPVAQAVIRAAGVPLAAPSANPSGRPSPTAFAHVRADLTGKVDALLDGGDCPVGVESTVLTLAEGTPRLLRPGGITLTELRSVLGEVAVDDAVLHKLKEREKAASPGMKYKHYAPRAEVFLVDASPEEYSNYVNLKEDAFALCFDEDIPLLHGQHLSYGGRYDGAAQARSLFAALHELDERGAGTVYAHMPRKTGIGLAVYNRLIRAAAFRIERPSPSVIVGLTGPSGAGKTTVGEALQKAGCAVVDCDAITHAPGLYDEACVAELQAAFGKDIAPGGVLDRRLLASRAFVSPETKKTLEGVVFPRIEKAVRKALCEAAAGGARLIFLDAPTLFESGLDSVCSRILAVTAPEEERLRRILARDGITAEQAAQRLAAQHPEAYYTDRAGYILENAAGTDISRALLPILDDLREEAP